jgi:hypothetical protein
MRLRTRRVTAEVTVGDDNEYIRVEKLRPSELAKIVEPASDFFSQRDGVEKDSVKRFENFIEEMAKSKDFTPLQNIIGVFNNLFRRMAIGWHGIEDEDGKELAFSLENVGKVIEHDETGFVCQFVTQAFNELDKQEEKLSKNCEAGSTGNSTPDEPAVKNAETLSSRNVETVTVQDGFLVETERPSTHGSTLQRVEENHSQAS